MPVRTILFSVAAIVCFAAAYRFTSHGISGRDNFCIGLGAVACAVGSLLLWIALRQSRSSR